MEEVLINAAASQGVWTIMSIFLLFYVLKTTEKRELKYQNTIEKLADKFGVVEGIKKDVEDIKELMK